MSIGKINKATDVVSELRAWRKIGADSVMGRAADEIERLRAERDEARLQTARILNEIDCRIEHGADSNGHLEAIYNLFKENTDV